MTNVSIQKLNDILKELNEITENDDTVFERIAERTKGIAKHNFLPDTTHIDNIVDLQSKIYTFYGLRNRHIQEMIGIVQIMIDELEINKPIIKETSDPINLPTKQKHTIRNDNLDVFIVHGHNDAMKEATARTIEKLGLKAIVLHEKANAGDTIIEKFTKHSDVGFAIVLLSADDYGYSKIENEAKPKLRARQNVIFELGFFYGKLGRKRVVAIFEQNKDFEKPSDIDGVIYIPYNSDGKWKFDLARELLEIGYQVDVNVLMK